MGSFPGFQVAKGEKAFGNILEVEDSGRVENDEV